MSFYYFVRDSWKIVWDKNREKHFSQQLRDNYTCKIKCGNKGNLFLAEVIASEKTKRDCLHRMFVESIVFRGAF